MMFRLMSIAVGSVVVLAMSACAGPQSSSPICLSGASLDSKGRCVAQQAPEHQLPFRAGERVRVTQGFYGFVSHREDLAYAVDFACEEGTAITASRDGVVWSMRRDSGRGCADPSCVDDANYVVLDHGDGTYSSYYHLQREGVVVDVGDQVCSGQVIGLCGNTGFSSGPHLHFSVMNSRGMTLPVVFRELRERSVPVALARSYYTSENHRRSPCSTSEYSQLSRDAFAHQGIMLKESVPVVLEAGRRTQIFRGQYSGEMSHIAVHRRAVHGGTWIEQCAPMEEDGQFALQVDWSTAIYPPGFYYLMITASDETCDAPGWSWSYRIRVD